MILLEFRQKHNNGQAIWLNPEHVASVTPCKRARGEDECATIQLCTGEWYAVVGTVDEVAGRLTLEE